MALFGLLLAVSIVGDVTALETSATRVKASSSFLAIVTAIVFLGETPAALIGVVTILIGWGRSRYPRDDLLINLVTYTWFPLLAGIGFDAVMSSTGTGRGDDAFYLLVFGLFLVALLIDFVLIAAYSSYVEGTRLSSKVRRVARPGPPLRARLGAARRSGSPTCTSRSAWRPWPCSRSS